MAEAVGFEPMVQGRKALKSLSFSIAVGISWESGHRNVQGITC